MGFYYGSNQPPDEEKPGGFKETLLIVLAVFQVLAIPLAFIVGVMVAIGLVIFLFIVHVLAGLAAVAVIMGALVARGVWEAKHPPELK